MLRHPHTHLPTLEGDALKKTIELHKTLGNKFLICPSLSAKDADGWMELAKKFNDIAARAKEYDMLVGYHSHASDFKKFDGKTAWEIFFDNTKTDVVHQLDTGNTIDGGGDPLGSDQEIPGPNQNHPYQGTRRRPRRPVRRRHHRLETPVRSLRIRRRRRVVHHRARNQQNAAGNREGLHRQHA